jgi:cobyrinic acid a,c-diamide synthase
VRAVRSACARAGIELLASIPHDPAVASFERHLGLDRADADARTGAIERIGEQLAAQIDLAELFPRRNDPPATNDPPPAPHVRIAVAEDEAFWFTYPETLLALRAAGAQIVPFSPLRGETLPQGVSGLWLGGGYPELHARELADNVPMRTAVRDAVRAGMPTYAECGGMMYLGETLVTAEGEFAMCGALRGATSIAEPRLTIGYRTAQVLRDGPLDAAERRIRGYEFRYASGTLEGTPAYRFDGGVREGVASSALCASFLHRHFTVGDAAVARFVATCAR